VQGIRRSPACGNPGRCANREFNDEVVQAARAIPGAAVRARVTKVGVRRVLVGRQDIGDVDVLVALREVGCVLALEAKNFLPSLESPLFTSSTTA
jgi:hypothetical protein